MTKARREWASAVRRAEHRKTFGDGSVGTIGRTPLRTRLRWYVPAFGGLVAAIVIVVVLPSISTPQSAGTVVLADLGTSMAGKPGVAVSGVRCAPGVRQVTWSKYAPICEPAWHGNNGGATWPGVTRNTITITYREPQTGSTGVLASLFPISKIGTDQQALDTMQAYIDVFNKAYELYGRKVVLQPYVPQGDFTNELQGLGVEQAKADAITAHRLGAFADVSLLSSTQLYDQDLAEEHIVAIGAIAQPQWWYQDFAPYEYSDDQNCDTGSTTIAYVLGRTAANLPAIFAGDPVIRHETRRFGLIYPENPTYASCGRLLAKILHEDFGVQMALVFQYTLSFGSEPPEALSAIEQMQAHGVTTVLCGCDPIFPILLTGDAKSQLYHPEWMALNFGDLFTQFVDQGEWAHAIAGGTVVPPQDKQEAYRVYKLSGMPKADMSPEFGSIYAPLALLFDALQAAGPNLNPSSFEQGFFRLPDSEPGGDLGLWHFGQHVFTPSDDFGIMQWSRTTRSNEDGALGTYVPCNGGRRYPDTLAGADELPLHRQVQCPAT